MHEIEIDMKVLFEKFMVCILVRISGMRRWYIYSKLRSDVKQEMRTLTQALSNYDDSDTVFEIVKVQSRRMDSKIDFAPVSGEFYISNSNEQYIIVTSTSVRIINGVYHYDVQMPGAAIHYLDKYLKRIVERRRAKIKRHMESKIDNSLKNILNKIQTR